MCQVNTNQYQVKSSSKSEPWLPTWRVKSEFTINKSQNNLQKQNKFQEQVPNQDQVKSSSSELLINHSIYSKATHKGSKQIQINVQDKVRKRLVFCSQTYTRQKSINWSGFTKLTLNKILWCCQTKSEHNSLGGFLHIFLKKF